MGSLLAVIVAGLVLLAGCSDSTVDTSRSVTIEVSDAAVQVLLEKASTTVLGQEIGYPDGRPEVSVSIVTIQPGAETGLHHHDAPLVAWVLEGTLTVDYGDAGERVYETGASFLEAVEVPHDGRNDGRVPVRILVVNLGSDAVANTVADN